MLVAGETTVAGQIDHETLRSGLDPFVDVQQRGQQELAPPGSWGDIRQSPDTPKHLSATLFKAWFLFSVGERARHSF